MLDLFIHHVQSLFPSVITLSVIMEKRFLLEFRSNAAFIDKILRSINQGFQNPTRPTSICGWFWKFLPIWFSTVWITIYVYLIFTQGQQAGLALVAQQIWAMMVLIQAVSKLTNGVFRIKMLEDLMKWCEECYTMDYRPEYVPVVNGVFRRTNIYISVCIR